MGKALQQLWLGMGTMFRAFEVLMTAVLHLCTWAEATAGAFKDEAEEDRVAKSNERKLALGITPEADEVVEVVKAKPKAKAE